MEGIGAAASIITLIDFSVKTVDNIQKFLAAYNDSSQTVSQLGQDVGSLSAILGRLSQCPLHTSSPGTIATLKDLLDKYNKEVVKFRELLARLKPILTGRAGDSAPASARPIRGTLAASADNRFAGGALCHFEDGSTIGTHAAVTLSIAKIGAEAPGTPHPGTATP